MALLNTAPGAEPSAGENPTDSRRAKRDQFFAEERRIMAKTWGLSEEKTADFEIAVHEMIKDRQAVFDRLTREKITPAEVSAGLKAAQERSRQRLLEALGPDRLLEYQLTAGHFVEAGLDRKPFVPPKMAPSPAPAEGPVRSGP